MITVMPTIPNLNLPIIGSYNKSALSISTSNGSTINIDDCFLQYLDLIASLIGIDINYEEFSKMDHQDRKGFVDSIKREIKLKKLGINE